MGTHCRILVWRSLWTEEPGGLQGVHGVAKSKTELSQFIFQCFLAQKQNHCWALCGEGQGRNGHLETYKGVCPKAQGRRKRKEGLQPKTL